MKRIYRVHVQWFSFLTGIEARPEYTREYRWKWCAALDAFYTNAAAPRGLLGFYTAHITEHEV